MKSFEDIKSEMNARWTGFTFKAMHKTRQAIAGMKENKEITTGILIPTGIVVIKTISGIAKSVDRKIDLKKEQDLKDLYIYDRSLGYYHELNRKLKPSEALEIDQRRSNGESMAQILASMKLLK